MDDLYTTADFMRDVKVDDASIADGITRDVAEANARLIAAAPTMHDYIEDMAASGDPKAQAILEAIHAGK